LHAVNILITTTKNIQQNTVQNNQHKLFIAFEFNIITTYKFGTKHSRGPPEDGREERPKHVGVLYLETRF
jgi:hypothetical protein